MKKFRFIFIFLVFIPVVLQAQTKAEKAVSAAVERLKLAMVSANGQDLDNVVMDNLSYGHSGGLVEGKKEFIDKLTSGKSDFVEIDLKDQSIQVFKNTGIVRHTLSARTNDNNTPGTVNLKILLIFVKQHGQWKLAARQAVKLI